MKRLMIALSAAAMAFGLYADGANIKSENFNASTDVPATITVPGDSTISTTPYTFTAGKDVGTPLGEDVAAGYNLSVKTAFNSPASFAMDSATTMAGLYFDSLVKFTACDEEPAAAEFAQDGAYAGAKLVVWVKEIEGAAGAITKELFVTAGYLNDANNTPVLKHYDCGDFTQYAGTDETEWCRLTIKAKADITDGDGVPGFVVFINAEPVTIATDKAIGVDGSAKDNLTKVNKIWSDADRLFPSLVAQESTLTSVGFAGQGGLDDLLFTTVEPQNAGSVEFALDPVPSIATVGSTDCKTLEDINNAIAAATEGATVTLLDDILGNLAFGAANFTLNLNGFMLNGGIAAQNVTMLTITGEGSVEGTVTPGRSKNVTIEGGRYLKSANSGLSSKVNVKEGFNLVEKGDYWELEEITEDGTADKPWQIGSAQDLADKLLANCAAGKDAEHMNFIMTDNIDLTDTVWDGPGESRTAEGAFIGVFDGQGYTISNLTLAKKEYNGFFGCLAGTAQVKNLTILVAGFGGDAPADGSYGAAGAVGFSMGTDVLVENVTVKGQASDTVLSGTHNVGGIGCRLEGKITLKNCTNELNIASTYSKVGGICAIASSRDAVGAITFDGCVNKGNGSVSSANGGKTGLAGILSYIENGLKLPDGKTDDPAGVKTLSIINCENTGTMTAAADATNAKIASIAAYPLGYARGTISGNKAKADILAVNNGLACDGLNFATVKDGVATFVADTDVVAGDTYKVMAAGKKAFSITLAKGETIAFDKALVSEFAATVTPAEGCKVTKSTDGTVTTYTCAELVKATAPTAATGLTYTGETLTGVAEGEGYTLSGDTTAVNAGEYTATAALAEGYDQWSDGTTEAKTIPWSIAKATPTITTAPTASAEIEKDAALKTISLVGGVASTAGTFAWTAPETTVAADGEFDVTFTPGDTTNYDTATCKVEVKVKTGGQDLPSDVAGGSDQQKADYAKWAKEAGVSGTGNENAAAFALGVTAAEIQAAGGVTKAVQAKLDAEITSEMVAALVAGTDGQGLDDLKAKYPNADFVFVPATELTSTDTAKFFKLQVSFKPANN